MLLAMMGSVVTCKNIIKEKLQYSLATLREWECCEIKIFRGGKRNLHVNQKSQIKAKMHCSVF